METSKPITLVREDFINNVIELVNNSGLPLFVVEDVLKNIVNDVSEAARQQLENDRQEYNQAMVTVIESDQTEEYKET